MDEQTPSQPTPSPEADPNPQTEEDHLESAVPTAASSAGQAEGTREALAEQARPRRSIQRIDQKLLRQYAEVRREQHELISGLIDTLGRVDDLPEAEMERARDALFHTDYPFLIVLVGPFSSGKSSVINALLGERILEVGAIPTTDHIHILRHGDQFQQTRAGEITTVFHPNSLLNNVSFVDTPGLESVFQQHDQVTRKFMHRADLVLLVMVATQVLSASDLNFLKELRAYGKRSIIVINQVDVLEEEDRQTVYDFAQEQSRLHLGFEPIIWLASARQRSTPSSKTRATKSSTTRAALPRWRSLSWKR
ncbi:MAG: hypothetical protein HC915_07045 [Anaerolineae bacterium]|nr:hypothetical protein [Anaerolineae bacterium]